MSLSKNASSFSIKRLEKTTDYVFGVAAAVASLSLQVPSDEKVKQDGLGPSIFDENWKRGIWQIYGQMILLMWWILHNDMVSYLRTANRSIVWINNVLLGCISLSIFTGFVWSVFNDEKDGHQAAFILHLALHSVIGGLFFVMWFWSFWKRRFIFGSMSVPLIRLVALRIISAPIIYLISICLSFESQLLATVFSLTVLVVFLLKSVGIDLLLAFSTTLSSCSVCFFSRFPILRSICPYDQDADPAMPTRDTLRIGENKFKISIIRLLNLIDAFFVTLVAMMVTQLTRPDPSTITSSQELIEQLEDNWAEYISYIVSALFLLLYWLQTSYMLGYLDRANTTLTTIHIMMIIGLSFVPFLAELLAQHMDEYSAILCFYLGLTIVQVGQIGIWCYIHYSQIAHIEKDVVERMLVSMCFNVVIYSVCICLGLVNTYAAVGISLIVPLLYVIKCFGFDFFERLHRCLFCLPPEDQQREMRDQTELLLEGEGEEITDSQEEDNFA